MEFLHTLYCQYPGIFHLYIGILGLLVGSFLNVVVYRLPVMMENEYRRDFLEYFTPDSPELKKEQPKFNLMTPRSRCPNCGHLITWWENIPVFSWLILRGKCHGCHQPISFRYPAVETLTCVLTVIVSYRFGSVEKILPAVALTWALIALAFIDYDKMLLPDSITLSFLWFGLLVNYFGIFRELHDAVIGAALGYGVLWSVNALFSLIARKNGMGNGDFKLTALFGAWFGYQCLPAIIIISSLLGLVIGGTLLLVRKEKSHPFPFGPYITIAGFIFMLFGDAINDGYIHFVLGGA